MNKESFLGHTRIDDISGLKNSYVTTRQQLYDLEFVNISKATRKLFLGKAGKILTFDFVISVHKDMFFDVWEWAGKIRTVELNLGVKTYLIRPELKACLDDLYFNESVKDMSLLERVSRFHHHLVKIHPFLNGNGRWSRVLVNYYLRSFKMKMVWPESDLYKNRNIREMYINALKDADSYNLEPLILLLGSWLK